MISLQRKPGQRLLELGGGDRPMVVPRCMGGEDINVDVRTCFNEQGQQTVDFTFDFEELPWPIGSDEFDAVIAHFLLEHLSYLKIPGALKEILRVLKPGGKAVLVTPNTEAQLKWIQSNPDGWDGKLFFESASENLFGSQDYSANAHKSFFSPLLMTRLLQEAGFEKIVITPYGARSTDMCAEALKPTASFIVPESTGVWDRRYSGLTCTAMVVSGVIRSGQISVRDFEKASQPDAVVQSIIAGRPVIITNSREVEEGELGTPSNPYVLPNPDDFVPKQFAKAIDEKKAAIGWTSPFGPSKELPGVMLQPTQMPLQSIESPKPDRTPVLQAECDLAPILATVGGAQTVAPHVDRASYPNNGDIIAKYQAKGKLVQQVGPYLVIADSKEQLDREVLEATAIIKEEGFTIG